MIAPGEVITILATGLGPATSLNLALDSSGKIATSLGGGTVSVAGNPAPLLCVSATQSNCVAPHELTQGIVFGYGPVPVVVGYGGQQ